jgi:uncharacterized protein YdiU (UPF0061 family)
VAVAPLAAEFEETLERETITRVVARLGLVPNGDTDPAVVAAAYEFMEESGIGYDRFFFDLYGGNLRKASSDYAGAAWEHLRSVLDLYRPLRSKLPAYFDGDAPCSLLIDEIEGIWSAIAERDDWAPFCAKIASIRAMGEALTRATES